MHNAEKTKRNYNILANCQLVHESRLPIEQQMAYHFIYVLQVQISINKMLSVKKYLTKLTQ